jgi:Serine protease inhibitor
MKSLSGKSLKKPALYLAAALSSFTFMSCDSDENDNERLPYAEPIVLKLQSKVVTDNTFAFDLFKTTYELTDASNVFVSPLSVNMALSMTLNGAANATLNEMKETLRATSYSKDDINEYNKSLRESLLKVDKSTAISIANSIWYHNSFSVKNEFISVNRDNYNAEIKAIDFRSSNAASQINNWVSDNTNRKIPTIIERLSPETVICLINAVYFKGIWREKFDKKNTNDEDFYSESGVSMGKVKMMNKTYDYLYTEDENCRYLRMFYGNYAYSMTVMLPNEGKSIEDVIANLNNESWENASSMMDRYDVTLKFPRFKTECSYEMHKSILPEMGMNIPFTNEADFSGINGDVPIKISNVIHKSFIEVNEEGTEAAAATIVSGELTAAGPPPPGSKIDYIVNRPFAFAISENSTGILLFMGKIGDVTN